MNSKIFTDDGEEFVIPLGFLMSFFQVESSVVPQIGMDFKFILQKDNKFLIEVKGDSSGNLKTALVAKLEIVGKPELRWMEHKSTIEEGSYMDKGFTINPTYNLNNNKPLLDFTIQKFTVPSKTTFLSNTMRFGYNQPYGIIFMLQPSNSLNHKTHYDTSNVSKFPTEVKRITMKGLSKDGVQELDIMYDFDDERHKEILWNNFTSLINHVNFIENDFNKYKNRPEILNQKTMTKSNFYNDAYNSTGLIYIDLTRDKGITDYPSMLLLAIEGTLEIQFRDAKDYERTLKIYGVFPRRYELGNTGDGFYSIINAPSAFQNS